MTAPITQAEWAKFRREATEPTLELMEQLGLPNVLLEYQSEPIALLESGTAVLVIEKSRRVGMTWGLASYATLLAARMRSAGGMDAMYISYSQEMTREFVDACAMWAKAYAVAAADVQEFIFDDIDPKAPDETRQIQAFRIRFASGFEILALSSAPRTLRGKQGLVVIDEAAFVDSLPQLLKAAMAFLMWGGKVVVCSTHDGVDNPFNQLVQDILGGKRKGKHYKVDFDEALRQGLYQRICLVTGEQWSPEGEAAWRQDIIDFYAEGADEELFCVPTMGSGSWLTAPLIEARMTLDPDEAPIIRISLPPDFLHRPELERRHLLAPKMEELEAALGKLDAKLLHAFGYDPARLADPAVIELLHVDRLLKRRSALTVEMRQVPFQEQFAISKDILKAAPRLIGAAIDATGMGMQLAEDLGREFGLREDEESAGLVWGIKLNTGWYNEHLPPLKTAFEDGSVALARDADHLGDLRLVKVIRGVPQIPPERTDDKAAAADDGPKKKRHGDFAVALALAHFASRMQWREYGYTPIATDADATPTSRSFDRPDHSDDFAARNPFRPPLGARIRGGF